MSEAFIEVYIPDEQRWVAWCQYSLTHQHLKLSAKAEIAVSAEFRKENNDEVLICEYNSLPKAQKAVDFFIKKFPQCKDMIRAVTGHCNRPMDHGELCK